MNHLAVALGLGVVLLSLSGCTEETFETTPSEITGLWNTTDESYSDRAFEITAEALYLLQGNDTISSHKIEKIRLSHDDLPFYTIEYMGEGDELFTFRFYLSQAEGGSLYFPNQRDLIWHRTHKAEPSDAESS